MKRPTILYILLLAASLAGRASVHVFADRSVLDRNFALRGNADDVVIVRSGMLTDTSIANISLYKEGKWFTPKYPLLKGTRRARLLAEGIIEEDIIMADSLHKYEKIRLFNAMISFGEVEMDIKNVFPGIHFPERHPDPRHERETGGIEPSRRRFVGTQARI